MQLVTCRSGPLDSTACFFSGSVLRARRVSQFGSVSALRQFTRDQRPDPPGSAHRSGTGANPPQQARL